MTLRNKNKVCIILATFNPNLIFFKKQVNSLINQTHKSFTLFICDDSDDPILSLKIKNFVLKININTNKIILKYRHGPKKGFAKNFLKNLSQIKQFDYYFFCDQDDIWFKYKIENAINKMQCSSSKKVLYFSSAVLINEYDTIIGFKKISKSLKPNNLFFQNDCSGHSMCLSKELRDYICSLENSDVIYHDWWIYLISTINNFELVKDNSPQLYYRIHSNNIIGVRSIFKRLLNLFENSKMDANTFNSPLLSNRDLFINNKFVKSYIDFCTTKNFLKKIYLLRNIRKSYFIGNLILFLKIILGRI